MPVHYSMDPNKDTAWKSDQRLAYESLANPQVAWDQEMEIAFQTVSGNPVFHNYNSMIHASQRVKYDPELPIRLFCDFNVFPMCWGVAQYAPPTVNVVDIIWLTPGSVEEACETFLDYYGDHVGEVIVYGDPSGHSRQQKDGKTHYHTMRLYFSGRNFKMALRVPRNHYGVKDSVVSVNAMLKDKNGKSHIRVDPINAAHLKQDLAEVVWTDDGKAIKKVSNPDHPYYLRTHAAEGFRNMIHREWPMSKALEKLEEFKPATKPIHPKSVLADNPWRGR